MYIYVHKYTYCRARVCVYDIIGTYIYMFTYFTQESYFIFREGVVVVILLAVNRVYGLCVYVHCCVYTHTHVGKILFPIFLKDILYPAPKNTLFRN